MRNCKTTSHAVKKADPVARIRAHFQAVDAIRRGICHLNAGKFESAEHSFRSAIQTQGETDTVCTLLGAAKIGNGKYEPAAAAFAKTGEKASQYSWVGRVRAAYAFWQGGKNQEAVQCIRAALHHDAECAELHFQLGTLLAALEEYEEAELRFAQAISIDSEHAAAHLNLGLCLVVRKELSEAVDQMQKAQILRPNDAAIALMLAQTAKAAEQQGLLVRIRAAMPEYEAGDDPGVIRQLERLIDADPDFVEAFLSLPDDRLNVHIYVALARTLEVVLQRSPRHPELHYQCGRVLARLGRDEDAIFENERAVTLDPKHVRALIELGKLYQKTDRAVDAADRLEQAIRAGAEYADVHFLLGNLYQRQGQIVKARSAYRKALDINKNYTAAKEALDTLIVSA